LISKDIGFSLAAELTITSSPLRPAGTRDILGVSVTDMSRDCALETLHRALIHGRHTKVAFCNAHTANVAVSNADFRMALGRFTVLPDGIGIDLAGRILAGRPFSANLNGTDIVPALVASSPRGLRIALIGGRSGVAERAAAALLRIDPRHMIVATCDGFAAPDAQAAWLAALEREPVDLLLVAMGNPLQELWIDRRVTPAHATVAVGVGALFDFLAGEVPRAPELMRRLRIEWLFRLAQEPRRLFRRYVVGNPLFLWRVLRARNAGESR
jgi:exopolysaccharide biosynthesis WecB/TagA/CpsF family protein